MESPETIKQMIREGEDLLGYWDDIKRWLNKVGINSTVEPGIYDGLCQLQQELDYADWMEQQLLS